LSKPVIVAVDDDPQVRNAVKRDLRTKYAADYRIIDAGSGAEAVEITEELKSRGDTVALFLVDQRMPEMSGTEFLMEARGIYPDATRVLLTAYADTAAAIAAINEVDLDHYLMKPWDPPDQHLYPVLDDLLDDWQANTPPPFDGIRVVGTRWSPATYETKDFFARNQVPYRFLDIERDPEAEAILRAGQSEDTAIPLVLFPDGTRLVTPDRRALAEQVGLQTEADSPFYDLIIVGGGPAGLAAAVYGASEGLRTVMIEQAAPGGQAGTSARIENYLGFPAGISGGDLARRGVTQATRLGAEIISAAVTNLRVEDGVKVATLNGGEVVRAHAVLVSTGMTVRRLAVPGYERFEGAGVYYGAAPSEAATYSGGEVFVIGGANSAGQAAMMFSRHAAKVTMIVRSDNLGAKMSQYLVDQIGAQPNIEVLLSTRVLEVIGEDQVAAIRLANVTTEKAWEQEAAALFIFVGAVPHSDFLDGVVARDPRGFIYTGPDLALAAEDAPRWASSRDPFPLETSAPGIFAAGDVRYGVVRRVASAVGQGSVAVSMIHQYLETV
jgi:thioredoxin reductase (NADPH)